MHEEHYRAAFAWNIACSQVYTVSCRYNAVQLNTPTMLTKIHGVIWRMHVYVFGGLILFCFLRDNEDAVILAAIETVLFIG